MLTELDIVENPLNTVRLDSHNGMIWIDHYNNRTPEKENMIR
jgi:hypothetical protein